MLKLVIIIFIVSCETCDGLEINKLWEFDEKICNLSLELFYFTEQETEGHVAMAPFTVWNLISLVAFKTSANSWKQLHSIFGVSKRNEQHFNAIFSFKANWLKQLREGRIYNSKQIVFYDANFEISLSSSFIKSIFDSGTSLKKLNFEDNILAAQLANDDIQLSNYSHMPKEIVFDKTDFEESSMIVSGVAEFSATWTFPFESSNTILVDHVPMMTQWARVRYVEIELLGASVLELPFGKEEEYSMLIIKPQEHVTIKEVFKNFDKISFFDVFQKLYINGLREVHVQLPIFVLNSVLILNGALMSMEAKDIFSWALANFSGITAENMYISTVEHRATIMVGERGIIAKASIPANLAKGASKDRDKMGPPFLFFIVHRPVLNIIFCGKYGE